MDQWKNHPISVAILGQDLHSFRIPTELRAGFSAAAAFEAAALGLGAAVVLAMAYLVGSSLIESIVSSVSQSEKSVQ